jgi:sn-glycerol 3-phosphate transport system permease protein
MLSTSFKEANELFTHEIRIIPRSPTIKNYVYVWTNTPFIIWLVNSAVTALGITICQVITSLLAAFSFGYYNFKGKRILFLIFIGSMIIPFAVIMIPNYIIISKLGLLNTWWAVILPYSVNGFGIFLLRQYILSFPSEIFDAAKIDGANSWKTLWYVLAPVIKAPIFALSIVFFLDAWNMYFWPLLVLTWVSLIYYPSPPLMEAALCFWLSNLLEVNR